MPNIQDEPAWDACAGVLYQLFTGRLADCNIQNDLDLLHVRMLVSDYANRSASIPASIQADFNSRIVGYFAGLPASRLLTGLGQAVRASKAAHPQTLDVGIIATRPEELEATALAFDSEVGTEAYQLGEPADVVELDCAHLAGRRLLVGIFGSGNSDAGSVSSLIAHMRHRRIPRLICLVGTAVPVTRNVSRFDVVTPRRVYRLAGERNQGFAGVDLTTAESLVMRDLHLHGLEAYDPAHTGYRERLHSLLRRIPRKYKTDVKTKDVRPRFASADCIAVTGVPVESVFLPHEGESAELAFLSEQICIADTDAYDFAESLPSDHWLIFRGIREVASEEGQTESSIYVSAGAAALCLRDFLENYYVPPGAVEF